MHNSGRDSGYCENVNLDFCATSRTTDVSSPTIPLFSSKSNEFSTPYIPCTPSTTTDDKIKDSRITGSSCRALKHAVSNLTRLDDFSCEKIGDGFFSEVFKVTHRVTGKVMVLKMNLLRSNRANMLKEVQLMNKLSHPNILKFMGVCVHEGQLHALTEYINGGSLEQLIQSGRDITYSVRMKLGLDIAKGMQYLHSREIFHRDLTSKNVLIRVDETSGEPVTAVVGDFGLAAKIPRSGCRLPTVGSPWWMSPECLKGKYYDESSDTFSYGIILCELIARIDADPDMLPRTSNFGLDYLAFVEICSQLPKTPPSDFLKLAFSCCNLEPKNRPTFSDIVKILEKFSSSPANRYILQSCSALTEARSEENLPSPQLLPATVTNVKNRHRKLVHRRSLSEDIGLITFPSVTAPSDKARCHILPIQQPPLKHVGESMCHEDPHYKPSFLKSNPFATLSQFKGVKKILASTNSTDLFSSCFELPSPFYGDDRKPSFYVDNAANSSNGSSSADCVGQDVSANRDRISVKSKLCTTKYNNNSTGSDNKNVIALLGDQNNRTNGGAANVRSFIHRNSSIIVESVVKPSDIKKSLLNSKTTSSNSSPIVTNDKRDNSNCCNNSSPAVVDDRYCCTNKEKRSNCTASLSILNKHSNNVAPMVDQQSVKVRKCRPLSLPSSPTYCRKNLFKSFEDAPNRSAKKVLNDETLSIAKQQSDAEDNHGCSTPKCCGKVCSSSLLFAVHPLYKLNGYLNDVQNVNNPSQRLRSCSSSSNVSLLNDCPGIFSCINEAPILNLKRRGSCESGFYSSVGDDFCVTGTDTCIGHHYQQPDTASSFTLSSSSAASSLFFDSTGEDVAGPLFVGNRYPFSVHHATSSTYTDSSEDISSLASNETPALDERQRPQQISKIVEYFERKQVGSSTGSSAIGKWEFKDPSCHNKLSSTMHAQLRRNWLQQGDGQQSRAWDYYTRRKLFEKPFSAGSHVFTKRSINQRLIVCEGAVKSKLQLFDKKS